MNIINKLIRIFLQKKGHGLSVKDLKKSITKEDYSFGDAQLEIRFGGTPVIKQDGQWDDCLPEKEIQHFSWGDTFHCTVYGTENCIQALMKAKYGELKEYSERYLGVLAGIRNYAGGSPHTVVEMWRKYGNVLYNLLPNDTPKSWVEFNSPNPMSSNLIGEGKKWLDEWSIGHDWIWNFSASSLKEALKYSPIGVGVYAWDDNDLHSRPSWANDNHWVMMYGYVDGKYWKVYDHYDNVYKKLAWDYPFAFAKRFTLEKKTMSEQEQREKGKSLYQRLLGKHIIRPEANGEVHQILDSEIKFCFWVTDCKFLQDNLNQGLKDDIAKGDFVGISEKDFANLIAYVNFAGIEVEDPKEKLQGLMNKYN